MTTYIRHRNGSKLQLNGDILTGDTYPVKDYIKKNFGGKWNAAKKAWQVDVERVNHWLELRADIYIDDEPVAQPDGRTDATRPQNMTYAEFSRRMNNPNSDL